MQQRNNLELSLTNTAITYQIKKRKNIPLFRCSTIVKRAISKSDVSVSTLERAETTKWELILNENVTNNLTTEG